MEFWLDFLCDLGVVNRRGQFYDLIYIQICLPMGLTTYNLNEKWWAISLAYYIYIYIYMYTYPKENVSHSHRLELVIP